MDTARAGGGDWITPHFNGVRYFDKPPLLYWLMAAGFQLVGRSEWSALAVVGAAMLVAWLGTRPGSESFPTKTYRSARPSSSWRPPSASSPGALPSRGPSWERFDRRGRASRQASGCSSDSGLPHYGLPAFPALALLAAKVWDADRLRQAWTGRQRLFLVSIVKPERSVVRELPEGSVHLLLGVGGRWLYSNRSGG